MWVFLDNGTYLSIVSHRQQPHKLLVRARFEGDIEHTFPGTEVSVTPLADYRYRATLDREVVAARLFAAAMGLDYDNYKASLDIPGRARVYSQVWRVMANSQEEQQ